MVPSASVIYPPMVPTCLLCGISSRVHHSTSGKSLFASSFLFAILGLATCVCASWLPSIQVLGCNREGVFYSWSYNGNQRSSRTYRTSRKAGYVGLNGVGISHYHQLTGPVLFHRKQHNGCLTMRYNLIRYAALRSQLTSTVRNPR